MCLNWLTSALAHAAMTALPSATAPAPPLEKCSASTASYAPASRAISPSNLSSASVSVAKRLIATTACTPWARTFLMWATRLTEPSLTRWRFSSVYSFDRRAPGTTLGASPECSFAERTVQTITAHLQRPNRIRIGHVATAHKGARRLNPPPLAPTPTPRADCTAAHEGLRPE